MILYFMAIPILLYLNCFLPHSTDLKAQFFLCIDGRHKHLFSGYPPSERSSGCNSCKRSLQTCCRTSLLVYNDPSRCRLCSGLGFCCYMLHDWFHLGGCCLYFLKKRVSKQNIYVCQSISASGCECFRIVYRLPCSSDGETVVDNCRLGNSVA